MSGGQDIVHTPDVASNVQRYNCLIFRNLRPADGPDIHGLICASDALDKNSIYLYSLWCRDFADTSALVEDEKGICGILTAYARPEQSDTLFIWQALVDPRQRGKQLAARILDFIVRRRFRYVECTVTPSNHSSMSFLGSFARSRNTRVERSPLFGPELLAEDHEPEDLLRIGPLTTSESEESDKEELPKLASS